MKKCCLYILFFICLITGAHAQEYPHFKVEHYDFGNVYFPRGEIFQKDTLYYFDILFKDFNFVRPLKKMLQEILDKEIYQKYQIKEDPSLGHINILYNEKGKVLRIEIRIYKEYLYLFPDKLLWKIYRKISSMKLKLSPIRGAIIKRPRKGSTQWLTDEEGESVIAVFGEKVKQLEFFPLDCWLNREVDFGIEDRFTDQEK